jgi:hypothetical protein
MTKYLGEKGGQGFNPCWLVPLLFGPVARQKLCGREYNEGKLFSYAAKKQKGRERERRD